MLWNICRLSIAWEAAGCSDLNSSQSFHCYLVTGVHDTGTLSPGGHVRRVPEECTEEIAALIKDCLSADPDQRPSSTAIFHVLQHQASLAPVQSNSGVASPQNSLGAPTNSR